MNIKKIVDKVLETHMNSQINLASKAARGQLAAEIAAAVEVKDSTDTRILDEVYSRLNAMVENDPSQTGRALKSLIEEEWQTADYLARLKDAGVGPQGEIGVTDKHLDGCGYDDREGSKVLF